MVIVFLVWVYTQAVILLYGVEFTAAYAQLRRGRPEESRPAPTTATRARARMSAALNAGTSSGFREVIRLPSSTTGLSTCESAGILDVDRDRGPAGEGPPAQGVGRNQKLRDRGRSRRPASALPSRRA
mgnify:CR=1 FL=1